MACSEEADMMYWRKLLERSSCSNPSKSVESSRVGGMNSSALFVSKASSALCLEVRRFATALARRGLKYDVVSKDLLFGH